MGKAEKKDCILFEMLSFIGFLILVFNFQNTNSLHLIGKVGKDQENSDFFFKIKTSGGIIFYMRKQAKKFHLKKSNHMYFSLWTDWNRGSRWKSLLNHKCNTDGANIVKES